MPSLNTNDLLQKHPLFAKAQGASNEASDSESLDTTTSTTSEADSKKAGKRKPPVKYIAPFVVATVAVLFALLMVYPMTHLSAHNLPIAICSVDKGYTYADETINAGDTLIENITSGEDSSSLSLFDDEDEESENSDDSADESNADEEESGGMFSVSANSIAWTVFDSEEEMNQAVSDGKYYAALTIPEDFSEKIVGSYGRSQLSTQLLKQLPSLAEGTEGLSTGIGAVATGSAGLSSGLEKLSSGSSALADNSSKLSGYMQSLSSGTSSLSSGLSQLNDASSTLASGTTQIGEVTTNTGALIAAAQKELEKGDYDAAAVYLEKASQANTATQTAVDQLSQGTASLHEGINKVSEGANGLDTAASSLATGTEALSKGADTLAQGSASAYKGSSTLASGTQALSSGVGKMSDGLATANDALNDLPGSDDDDADENTPTIKLFINPAINPMVTSPLESNLSNMSAYGVSVDTSYTAEIPDELSSGYAHMPLLMLTYLGSMITGIVISLLLRPFGSTRAKTACGILKQIVVSLLCSLFIGALVAGIFQALYQAPINYVDLTLFLSLCSLAIQFIIIASLDLLGIPGIIIPLLMLALCMLSAYLPFEFLPDFWQTYIYPWNPLRFMTDGFKAILYTGAGYINKATMWVCIVALIAAGVLALNLLKKPEKNA